MAQNNYPRHSAVYAHLGVEQTSVNPSPTPTMDDKPKKKSSLVPFLVVLGVLLVVYFGGVFFFSNAFYPSTTLDGNDVSLKFAKEIAQAQVETGERSHLTVSIPDGQTLELNGSDVSLKIDGDAYARSAMTTQQPWFWPVRAWGSHVVKLPISANFDQSKLKEVVAKLVEEHNSGAKQPKNASARFDDKSKNFQIIPAEEGTTLNTDYVETEVAKALTDLKETLTLTKDAYIQPTVKDDDETLNKAVEKANSMLKATQSLTIEGKEVVKVDVDKLGSWISISDKNEATINVDAIRKWTQGDLSKQLDTVGSTRTYSLPDGGKVSVSGGRYGWVIDGADVADSIVSNVKAGKSASIEVSMKQKAVKHADGGADWGDRWVDVNLSTQHAVLYDKGKTLWESSFVSGNSNKGYSTPTGVYSINSNMTSKASSGSPVKLVSPFKDSKGKPTYTSYVDWWVPFIDNQYAFHDASWRKSSEFGGDTYKSNGSHGCINLPPDKAKALYKLVSVGDVVVVHD